MLLGTVQKIFVPIVIVIVDYTSIVFVFSVLQEEMDITIKSR